MKYDELIGKLRGCEGYRCEDCELRREEFCNLVRMEKAADVIEELQNKLNLWRQDKIRRWIPVSERLPKIGEMVAVYMHSAIHGDEVKIDRMVISNTTDTPYWSYYKGRVKAWMPLPEPPKEEK